MTPHRYRIGTACAAACSFIASASAAGATAVDVDGLYSRMDERLRNRAIEMASRPALAWPHFRADGDATWSARPSPGWDSGYFPGLLWQAYRRNGDPQFLRWARTWTNGLIGLGPDDAVPADLSSLTLMPDDHDVGITYLTSFGEGVAATGSFDYTRVMFRAAQQLRGRYDPARGVIRSWDWGPWAQPVIIDSMMSVQTLHWSVQHGGPASHWFDAATHARQVAIHHVRDDGSTFHVVDFGQPTPVGSTYQGYADGSTWARGQAWAIHGFAESFKQTGDALLIDAARAAADRYLVRAGTDVPMWDLELPVGGSPELYKRDASAAAIAASGLIALSGTTTVPAEQRRYFQSAEAILNRLASPDYFAADVPGETRVLLHSVSNHPAGVARDAAIVYADYYFSEALARYEAAFPGPGIVAGDADRDGTVDFDDLLTLAQHYGTATAATWLDGDFDRSGSVTFDDLLALAQRYGQGEGLPMSANASLSDAFSAEWALAQSLVPEPGMAVVVMMCVACVGGRRAREMSV